MTNPVTLNKMIEEHNKKVDALNGKERLSDKDKLNHLNSLLKIGHYRRGIK